LNVAIEQLGYDHLLDRSTLTAKGYVGTDFDLHQLVDHEGQIETATALDRFLSADRPAGKMGERKSAASERFVVGTWHHIMGIQLGTFGNVKRTRNTKTGKPALTAKEQAFVNSYVREPNVVKAARAAGYKSVLLVALTAATPIFLAWPMR
jgi:hypothetical protein